MASIFDNKFCIPLDLNPAFLESSLPLYQYGLGSHLTYELTFVDYSDVIKASNSYAAYTISNISRSRILRARIIPLNDSNTSFSVEINSPSKSLKGVLLIFMKERSATKFNRDTEEFFNPKITKVEVTVEGVPNELYA